MKLFVNEYKVEVVASSEDALPEPEDVAHSITDALCDNNRTVCTTFVMDYTVTPAYNPKEDEPKAKKAAPKEKTSK